MNTHTLVLAGLAALALSACGEKKMDEPIPDTWAKAECPADTGKAAPADGRCAQGRGTGEKGAAH